MAASNEFLKFRSAINGFHRADVVNFLEQNARQQAAAQQESKAQIAALQAELAQAQAALSDQAASLRDERSALDEEKAALTARQAELRAANAALQAQYDALGTLRDELLEQIDTLTAQRDAALQAADEFRAAQDQAAQAQAAQTARLEQLNLENLDLTARLAELLEAQSTACSIDAPTQELAAYRRAEAAERNAFIRARHLYQHLRALESALCATASHCGDEAGALRQTLSSATQQLDALTLQLTGELQHAATELETLVPNVKGGHH